MALTQPQINADPALLEKTLEVLRVQFTTSVPALAKSLGIHRHEAFTTLRGLCRLGRATYHVEKRLFRHRELFAEPINEAEIYPPNPRLEAAERWIAQGTTSLVQLRPQEKRQIRRYKTSQGPMTRQVIFRDWQIIAEVGSQQVEIVVNDAGQLIFGRCDCGFFRENLLAKGPCEHMLAAWMVSEKQHQDLVVNV